MKYVICNLESKMGLGREKMAKTIEEINEKIKKGKAIVFTAEEIIDYASEKGLKKGSSGS